MQRHDRQISSDIQRSAEQFLKPSGGCISGLIALSSSSLLVPWSWRSKQRALVLSNLRECFLTSREYFPPVMADFQRSRASLASVSIMPPSESTSVLKGRSEGGCRRRFSIAIVPRCFSTGLAVLSAKESSSMAARDSVAVWEAFDAKGTEYCQYLHLKAHWRPIR
jgi:hypothetical protein